MNLIDQRSVSIVKRLPSIQSYAIDAILKNMASHRYSSSNYIIPSSIIKGKKKQTGALIPEVRGASIHMRIVASTAPPNEQTMRNAFNDTRSASKGENELYVDAGCDSPIRETTIQPRVLSRSHHHQAEQLSAGGMHNDDVLGSIHRGS